MKKIGLILLIIQGLITTAFSQKCEKPIIFDRVTVNGKWTADNCYRVNGYVRIDFNSVLEIEPGTVIEFTKGSYMEVYGRLLAQGKISDSIRFKAVGDSKDWWGGVRFQQNARMPAIDFCRFENFGASETTISGALQFNCHNIPNITNCVFN